ncbi:hypothetical protein RHMOL_Rhmol04G0280800 [Rhododendron molle]|uniref:Uncharacterized protein n=1 Tax=Rhododendron molle TaxID=49168 RepID=A0ACC0P5G5_RHOML|nr:hypothetical protein RHMOL_Rhmol04G0280800 [Rhododendron molle]
MEGPSLGLSSGTAENEGELELGLGLSLGGGSVKAAAKGSQWGDYGRILTAKDFPNGFCNRAANTNTGADAGVGTKRAAADSVSPTRQVGSPAAAATPGVRFVFHTTCHLNHPRIALWPCPMSLLKPSRTAQRIGMSSLHGTSVCVPASSQVVGWPPIKAYRMNSLVNQAKSPNPEEDKGVGGDDVMKDVAKKKVSYGSKNTNSGGKEIKGHIGFVKVNMDGLAIGRKVDLNSHASYDTLAQALEEMFFKPNITIGPIRGEKEQATKPSKLLDGSSDFVLTYEDKEGDWMLVGDVPWGFLAQEWRKDEMWRITSELSPLSVVDNLAVDSAMLTCLVFLIVQDVFEHCKEASNHEDLRSERPWYSASLQDSKRGMTDKEAGLFSFTAAERNHHRLKMTIKENREVE